MTNVSRFMPFAALLLMSATAAAAPSLSITARDAGLVQVKASGFEAGTVCTPFRALAIALRDCQEVPGATAEACREGRLGFFDVPSATAIVSDGVLGDSNTLLASDLLDTGTAWCFAPSDTKKPLEVRTAIDSKGLALPLVSTTGAWRSFDTPNRFVWSGWDRREFSRLLEAQPSPWTCEFTPVSTPINACRLVKTTGPGGGIKLLFDADRPLSKDTTITVKAKGGQKLLEGLTLDACTYTVKTGTDTGLDGLYAGATEQRLEIAASGACINQLAAFPSVGLALGGAEPIDAVTDRVEAPAPADGAKTLDGKSASKLFLRVATVPAELGAGTQEFEIRTPQSVLGTLRTVVRPWGLRTITDAARHPVVGISYGSNELDAGHSGKGVDGAAVVTPKAADGSFAIMNGVSIEVESGLQRLGDRLSLDGTARGKVCQDLWQKHHSNWFLERKDRRYDLANPLDSTDSTKYCQKAVFAHAMAPIATEQRDLDECMPLALEYKIDSCRESLDAGDTIFDELQGQQVEAHRNHRPWNLKALSWGGDLWFDENWLRRVESRQLDMKLVRFAVYQPQTDGLKATAELRDHEGKVLFRADLLLAEGARLESLPLPVGNALHVECGTTRTPRPEVPPSSHRFGASKTPAPKPAGRLWSVSDSKPADFLVRDTLRNGAVKAVYDEDLDSGQCFLIYDPADMKAYLHQAANQLEDPPDEKTQRDAVDEKERKALLDEQKLCEAGVASDEHACVAKIKAEQVRCQGVPPAQEPTCDQVAVRDELVCHRRARNERPACAMLHHDEVEDIDPLLHLYGLQQLEVTITRGSETPVTKALSFDPARFSRWALPGLKTRSGDYKLLAHLKGPSPQSVLYRPGPQQASIAAGQATDPSMAQEFRAEARPRGQGIKLWDSARGFITFPIRFTGLRFPAKSSKLSSSSDITAVQLAGIRLGVMGALEPWNFNTRQNPAAVPWRFMTGFNLYDLGTGKFEPAYLAGLSVSLPVLAVDGTPNARNLSSSVAVGLFWELDLERHHPFKDGQHVLLTLGVDVSSLLSE